MGVAQKIFQKHSRNQWNQCKSTFLLSVALDIQSNPGIKGIMARGFSVCSSCKRLGDSVVVCQARRECPHGELEGARTITASQSPFQHPLAPWFWSHETSTSHVQTRNDIVANFRQTNPSPVCLMKSSGALVTNLAIPVPVGARPLHCYFTGSWHLAATPKPMQRFEQKRLGADQ